MFFFQGSFWWGWKGGYMWYLHTCFDYHLASFQSMLHLGFFFWGGGGGMCVSHAAFLIPNHHSLNFVFVHVCVLFFVHKIVISSYGLHATQVVYLWHTPPLFVIVQCCFWHFSHWHMVCLIVCIPNSPNPFLNHVVSCASFDLFLPYVLPIKGGPRFKLLFCIDVEAVILSGCVWTWGVLLEMTYGLFALGSGHLGWG